MSEEKRLKERLLALAADCRNQGAFTGRSYSAIAADLEQLASEVNGVQKQSEEWTRSALAERVSYWQERLRLQDWEVEIRALRESVLKHVLVHIEHKSGKCVENLLSLVYNGSVKEVGSCFTSCL